MLYQLVEIRVLASLALLRRFCIRPTWPSCYRPVARHCLATVRGATTLLQLLALGKKPPQSLHLVEEHSYPLLVLMLQIQSISSRSTKLLPRLITYWLVEVDLKASQVLR